MIRVMAAGALVIGLVIPAMAKVTIIKGATVCRTFDAAKAMQWADAKGTAALIRTGKCYTAKGDAPTISAESGPDIVEFRTADNPGVLKFTLGEYVRDDAPARPPVASIPSVAAPASAKDEAMTVFKAGLDRFCPTRHLEWLNPGIIVEGFDSYLATLTPGERVGLKQRAADDLNKCEMGASCGNDAYTRAIFAQSDMARLTKHLCGTVKYTCIAPYDCVAD